MTNITQNVSVDGMVGLIQLAHSFSEDLLGPALSLFFFVLFFLAFLRAGIASALAGASFIVFNISVFFYFFEILPEIWLYGWGVLFVVSMAWGLLFEG